MKSAWILLTMLSLAGCRSLASPNVESVQLRAPSAAAAPAPARAYPDLPLKQMTPSQSAARMR